MADTSAVTVVELSEMMQMGAFAYGLAKLTVHAAGDPVPAVMNPAVSVELGSTTAAVPHVPLEGVTVPDEMT